MSLLITPAVIEPEFIARTNVENSFSSIQKIDVLSENTALQISQSGNGQALTINNTGTGNSLLIEDSTSPDTSPVVVTADGQLIIGATAGAVGNLGNIEALQVVGTGAEASSIGLYSTSPTASVGFRCYSVATTAGSSLGGFAFFGYDGSAYKMGAQIFANFDADTTTGIVRARLVFRTTDNTGTNTERMRIDSLGQVIVYSGLLGPSTTQQHTLPAVTSDTFTLNNAAQTLTNKTLGPTIITESGTAVPLTITNTGTGNSLVIEDSTSPDATAFSINADGQVSIGNVTTTGNAALNIFSDQTKPNSNFNLRRFSDTATDCAAPAVQRARGTILAPLPVTDGDALGGFYFGGQGVDGVMRTPVSITAVVDGVSAGSAVPASLIFKTTAEGGSTTERMCISADGQVLVGATTGTPGISSQVESLQVVGTGAASSSLGLHSVSDTLTANARQYRKKVTGSLVAGDGLGLNGWFGWTGAVYTKMASITATVETDLSGTIAPSRMSFLTTRPIIGEQEALRLDSLGEATVFGGKLGPNTTQHHTLPAVTSDTFALLNATQTLINKTLTAPAIDTPDGTAPFSVTSTTAVTNLNADRLDGYHATYSNTVSTVAARDSNGDLYMRLPRTSYADETSISGAMVFRVNNTTDNYLRACSNTSAIKTFLGLGNVTNESKATLFSSPVLTTPVLNGLLTGTGIDVAQRAPIQPTLDLDFANQRYRVYEPGIGLKEIALADIMTYTGSARTYTDALGILRAQSSNVPRLEFDPVTGAGLGLSVWASRKNTLTYSEQFDNAAWGRTSTSITPNAAIAPDGLLTADQLKEDTINSSHTITQSQTITSGLTYTYSVYAKETSTGTKRYLSLLLASTVFGTNKRVTVDLATGSKVTTNSPISTDAQPVGNGWWRVSITATATATLTGTNLAQLRLFNAPADSLAAYLGDDAAASVYLWGAQLEDGTTASPYIPTTTQVTAPADIASITGANFSKWYSQLEGTFVVVANFDATASVALRRLWSCFIDSNNRMASGLTTAGRVSTFSVVAGITIFALDGAVITNAGQYANAASYAKDNFANSFAGEAITTDTLGDLMTQDKLYIGSQNGLEQFNGTIRRILYFPRALPASLQALSA